MRAAARQLPKLRAVRLAHRPGDTVVAPAGPRLLRPWQRHSGHDAAAVVEAIVSAHGLSGAIRLLVSCAKQPSDALRKQWRRPVASASCGRLADRPGDAAVRRGRLDEWSSSISAAMRAWTPATAPPARATARARLQEGANRVGSKRFGDSRSGRKAGPGPGHSRRRPRRRHSRLRNWRIAGHAAHPGRRPAIALARAWSPSGIRDCVFPVRPRQPAERRSRPRRLGCFAS